MLIVLRAHPRFGGDAPEACAQPRRQLTDASDASTSRLGDSLGTGRAHATSGDKTAHGQTKAIVLYESERAQRGEACIEVLRRGAKMSLESAAGGCTTGAEVEE